MGEVRGAQAKNQGAQAFFMKILYTKKKKFLDPGGARAPFALCLGPSLPWLCIEDYNEILSHSEKSGGRLRLARQLDRFLRAIDLCGFHDLGFVGSPFTWSKTDRLEGSLRIRFDRALANNAWRLIFTSAVIHHIPMSTSDHSMLSLHLQDDRHNHRKNKRLF